MTLRNLDRLLRDWVQEGFLSTEQASRILQFEEARAPASRLMLALTVLAVLSIGLGIISLIASNWDQIPASFKLGVYFTFMLGQVLALLRWDDKPGLRREGLHFFFCLSILAGIGLIAQIFHVPSSGWRGAALWSALSFGIMLRARAWYTVWLWYGSFSWAWLAFIFESSTERFLRLESFMATLALLSMGASWKGTGALPEPQRSITLHLGSFLVLVAGPWCMVARSALGRWAVFDGIVAGLLALVWILLLSRQLPRALLFCAVIVALGFFARCWIAGMSQQQLLENWPNFLETVAFVVQLSALGLLALQRGQGRLFDALTLLMAARIFLLFFTLFGTLFMTGAGLILFGSVVLFILHLWYRYHDRLQARLKGILV